MVSLSRCFKVAVAVGLIATFIPSVVAAQQAEAPAVESVAPAPAPAVTPPAPKPSPLFEPKAPEAPSLAAAERAHAAENSQGRHVISMSTLTLVLVIVILVLLID